MPTTLVASILLMHRKGISEDELVKKVGWLGLALN
jgi:predicted DNA-binding transcriptional regulator